MKIDEIIEVVDKIKDLRKARDKFDKSLICLQCKIKRLVENEFSIHIEIHYDKLFDDAINYDFDQCNSSKVRIAILADLQLEAEQLREKIKECDEEIEKLSKLVEN